MSGRKLPSLATAKRIVIKLGSNLVADIAAAKPRAQWLAALAEDIAVLHEQGKEIILVSSGAGALGRPLLGFGEETITLEEKQAAAAVGQPLLMQAWSKAFAEHDIHVAQILLTLDDSERRKRYLNARETFSSLLKHRVIPIVNENDTVATAEIKVGDNDRLAARVAVMTSADILVLFSDIEGLYDKDPRKHADAEFIAQVEVMNAEILAMGGNAASGAASGGMKTKLDAATMVMAAGCSMAIAEGTKLHPLQTLMDGGKATWFLASTKPQIARKHWIATSMQAAGTLIIDEGAERALGQGKSLLPAGIIGIEGRFDRGDTVAVKNATGTLIARGIAGYSAEEAKRIIGKKTDAIAGILGYEGRDTLIHRDDLALL